MANEEKQPALVEVSPKKLESSFYQYYAPLCCQCGNPMDHPPIRIMIEPPMLKAPMGNDAPPYAEGEALPICRECILEALAPLENPHEANPRAGWYFRAILRGDLEPRGISGPGAKRLGEALGKAQEARQGNTEGD